MADERLDIRLPTSERAPLDYLLRRVAIAVGLIAFVALLAYVDRDGYRDVSGRRSASSTRSTTRRSP